MPTKATLTAAVQAHTGIVEKKFAERLTKQVLQAIMDEARKGPVVIRGIGTFKLVERKARTARNPRTGEVVPVAPRTVVTFKQSAKAR